MNGDSSEIPVRKDRRSLSFSHSRYRKSSSSEDDESPVRNVCFQSEFDDGDTRDSLSEFSRVTLNEQHRNDFSDDLSAFNRKRTFSASEPSSADVDSTTNGKSSEKRAATKVCRVCGDKAYSYNFSVVTCESCKAFFRRNANKDKDIRCPFNDNCDINIVSRRFCQKCRLAKCFKVGMKKEWIMSEEARREKKQRIQDNRERRMAERAQEEKMSHQNMAVSSSIPNVALIDPTPAQIVSNGVQLTPPSDTTMIQQPIVPTIIGQPNIAPLAPLTSAILPNMPLAPVADIPSVVPSIVQSIVQPTIASQPEPTSVMQQAIQQAQQVQNAQILAAAIQNHQSDAMATIQQAAQIAINTTAVPAPTSNAISAANLNHLAQVAAMQAPETIASIQQAAQIVQSPASSAIAAANLNHLAQVAAMQTPSDTISSIQQAAQIVQSPTTTAACVANLNNLAQVAANIQQINANIAAHRIQASQNLADQQQLAATAIAVAAAVSNPPVSAEPIQQSLASAILPSAVPIAPALVEPVMQPVLPPTTNPNEMIAVRKDVLMGIVQENIENRQAQIQQQLHTPPAKCKCVCQCGRYQNDSVIVDKVMADMLHEVKHTVTPVVSQHPVESMDYSRSADTDCCLLSEEDKMALNELEQADKLFWQNDMTTIDTNAADAALRKLIRMVTSLSSFNKFSRSDQSSLLKNGCASHFAIRQAMTGLMNESHSQNLMVTQFYNSLREELRSNRQLMLLLSILLIFDSDAPNIENKQQLLQVCTRLKSILKRMLFTIYQDSQKAVLEFDDLINKLNVLQSLNNTIPQDQNGVDSHRLWSVEILEPLLSRELFEPSMMTSNAVNTISSISSMS